MNDSMLGNLSGGHARSGVRLHARARRLATRGSTLAIVAALVSIVASCATVRGASKASIEMWAFAAPWDPRSGATLAAHGAELDAVVSGFITIDSASFRPVLFGADTLATSGTARRLALVSTYQGSSFHTETVRGLATDSVALGHTAGATAMMLEQGGYRGAVLDFEALRPNDLAALLTVSRAFSDSARAHGVAPVGMAVPATDTAAYPARPLLSAVDFLVVMLYDQHWSTSPPGPIASPDWAMRALGARVGEVGPSRLVAGLPTYGYLWRTDSATAVISYAQGDSIARAAHVALTRDPASATLHAASGTWTEWVSDAVQLDSLMRAARARGITRFALWRAGLEDPRTWPLIAERR